MLISSYKHITLPWKPQSTEIGLVSPSEGGVVKGARQINYDLRIESN